MNKEKFAKWAKPARSLLLAVSAFAGGSIVVARIGAAISAYGSDRRDSMELRNTLAEDAVRSATAMSFNLALNSEGVTPGAQLNNRCGSHTLPPILEADHDEVCRDAALEEIKEEQQQLIEFKRSLDEARSLEGRLHDQLERDNPEKEWRSVVAAFQTLASLESSTWCNEQRHQLVDRLRAPTEGTPASNRTALLDASLAEAVASTTWGDPASAPSGTVGEGLIGPTSDTGRCDNHGAAYKPASHLMREALVDEASIVADDVRRSHAALINDKSIDVLTSLLDFWYLVGALIAIATWIAARHIHVPAPPEGTS